MNHLHPILSAIADLPADTPLATLPPPFDLYGLAVQGWVEQAREAQAA